MISLFGLILTDPFGRGRHFSIVWKFECVIGSDDALKCHTSGHTNAPFPPFISIGPSVVIDSVRLQQVEEIIYPNVLFFIETERRDLLC